VGVPRFEVGTSSFLGCLYFTKLAPIFKTNVDLPPAAAKRRPASQNILLYNFLEGARKIFSIKEKQNVLLGSALTRGRRD
jgi:hypothetical protein